MEVLAEFRGIPGISIDLLRSKSWVAPPGVSGTVHFATSKHDDTYNVSTPLELPFVLCLVLSLRRHTPRSGINYDGTDLTVPEGLVVGRRSIMTGQT